MISDLTQRLQQVIGVTAETQIDVVSTLLVVSFLWLARKLLQDILSDNRYVLWSLILSSAAPLAQ